MHVVRCRQCCGNCGHTKITNVGCDEFPDTETSRALSFVGADKLGHLAAAARVCDGVDFVVLRNGLVQSVTGLLTTYGEEVESRHHNLMLADLVPLDFSILVMIEREQKTKCQE